jgi:XTP/dITP diphosphohydrolase
VSGVAFVLATANPDKAEEVRAILTSELGDRIVLLERPLEVAQVEEIGETLEENARLKAAALVGSTGRAAIADDTGLEVAALGGAPGVYSARFAGEHATYFDNVAKLLAELGESEDRTACFSTVAIAIFPDGTELCAEGVVEGRIARQPSGDGGFGYDPIFIPIEGDGRSFAEMSSVEKHALSHRGRAFRLLAARLAQQLG